ncbi:MAG: hypothetical protein M3Z19_14695, partial [Chloroflexota bacterium]|nr:hypothetical protein [Chloroflexota bacterium]
CRGGDGADPTRYQPLIDLLATSERGEVALTYKEIAGMIGGPLPESTFFPLAWWTYGKKTCVQLWRAARWRARAGRDHLRVIFTRNAEKCSGLSTLKRQAGVYPSRIFGRSKHRRSPYHLVLSVL